MNCIVIDDEEFSREILALLILKSPNLVLIESFESAIDAIKYLNENNTIDLIFLDIHLPNFSGFDFVKTIKNPPKVILVTTDKNFAIEAFNYDCISDYLLKPIQEERFEKAIQKVVLLKEKFDVKTNSKDKFALQDIYVNINKRLIKIDVSTIKFIKANGDYIVIKTDTVNYTVHATLKKIYEKLPNNTFFFIHRSYIININKIIDIKDFTVLIGNDIIPLSKKNRNVLMEKLYLL